MANEKPTPYTGLFKRLLAPFLGESASAEELHDGAAVEEAYESVTQLNALMAELSRLRALKAGEVAKEAELEADRRETEDARIAALTEYKVSGDAEAKKTADKLLKKAEEIAQQKNDCQAVADGKGDAFDIDERDAEIYRKFNGRNLNDLVAEYKLSVQQVYRILAKVRTTKRAEKDAKG